MYLGTISMAFIIVQAVLVRNPLFVRVQVGPERAERPRPEAEPRRDGREEPEPGRLHRAPGASPRRPGGPRVPAPRGLERRVRAGKVSNSWQLFSTFPGSV